MRVLIDSFLMDNAASSAQKTAQEIADQAADLFRMAAGGGDHWDDVHQQENLDNNQLQMKKTSYHVDGLHTESGKLGGVGWAGRECGASVSRALGSYSV